MRRAVAHIAEQRLALAREVYHGKPRIAERVLEGGELAASNKHVFADANLLGRNLGRGDATRAQLGSTARPSRDRTTSSRAWCPGSRRAWSMRHAPFLDCALNARARGDRQRTARGRALASPLR